MGSDLTIENSGDRRLAASLVTAWLIALAVVGPLMLLSSFGAVADLLLRGQPGGLFLLVFTLALCALSAGAGEPGTTLVPARSVATLDSDAWR